MRTAPFLPILALLAAQQTGCEVNDLDVETAQLPIVGGADHTGDQAVVLLDLGTKGYCTGTLIAPRVVLTAAHCLALPAADILVRFTPRAEDPGPTIRGRAHAVSANSDLGVLALAEPVTWIQPIPFNDDPAGLDYEEPIRLVGYGATGEQQFDYGTKRLGFARVDTDALTHPFVRSDEIATTNDSHGTCYGDSGGPNLMAKDGLEYVVAVTSRGSSACGAGIDVAVRTDAHAEFIWSFVLKNDPGHCETGTCEQALARLSTGGCSSGPGAGSILSLILLAGALSRILRRR